MSFNEFLVCLGIYNIITLLTACFVCINPEARNESFLSILKTSYIVSGSIVLISIILLSFFNLFI